jgi:hypothetical protein
MSDPRLKDAEWRWQPLFIKLLILCAFLLLGSDSRLQLPDRKPRPDRVAALRLEPLRLAPITGQAITVTDAWQLSADDRRIAGLSALAVLPDGRLQALSDSGVLVTFAGRGGTSRALVSELGDGPGYPTFKKYRDAEAMVVDADGGRRFVTFEYQHSLWRFTEEGRGKRVPVQLPSARWKKNSGIEAMVGGAADGLLLFHEGGRELFRIAASATLSRLPLAGATGAPADAARLPDGRVMVAIREIGPLGLSNRLAWLERAQRGYRLRNFAILPLGQLDNVEGLAAEPMAGGGTRLWAITDNDGWRRTLLLRMELDPPASAEVGATSRFGQPDGIATRE